MDDLLAATSRNMALFTPKVDMWSLTGPRKVLILYPRGTLKSTISTLSHSIQWIINYPNIRILISTATQRLALDFVKEIKRHFTSNDRFRWLFPEFCPTESGSEMGNSEEFTVLCRDLNKPLFGAKPGAKESTVRIATVGTALAGGRCDVRKDEDLVDKENSKTEAGIESVIWHFGLLKPLLQTTEEDPGFGWIDMAGTPYDFSDLYAVICNGETALKPEDRSWKIVRNSAAPNWPDGPFLWPERLGYKQLREIEMDAACGPGVLFPQYLMKPIVAGQGLVNDENEISWIPRNRLSELLPRLTLYAALDLAGMDSNASGNDNDYSALGIGGFARDGRLYIVEVLHGRPDPDTVISWIFDVFRRYPKLVKLKIEKEAHARVLSTFLKREMARRELWLPIELQARDNQQSKKDKIRGSQPWFKQGGIIFCDDLPCKSHIKTEITGFPKYRHDDILDVCIDLMHEKGGAVSDVMGRPKFDSFTEDDAIRRMTGYIESAQLDLMGWNNDEQAVDAITGWP